MTLGRGATRADRGGQDQWQWGDWQRSWNWEQDWCSRERIRQASRPPMHRHRTWSAGQRVLVWRTARGTERARWVGPGLVVRQNAHTVYVGMRSRLWKCNGDQLRPATSTEEFAMEAVTSGQYKDLLQQGRRRCQRRISTVDAWNRSSSRGSRGRRGRLGCDGSRSAASTSRSASSRSTNKPQARAGVRRMSIETTTEPHSEPSGRSLSARSDDTESKRRRLRELQTTPEESIGRGEPSGEASSPTGAQASSSAGGTLRNHFLNHCRPVGCLRPQDLCLRGYRR